MSDTANTAEFIILRSSITFKNIHFSSINLMIYNLDEITNLNEGKRLFYFYNI